VPALVLFFEAHARALPVPQASTKSDFCHVYVVDLEQAAQAAREMRSLKSPTEAQRLAIKEKYKDVEHRLGEFAAEVGEEELTTQSYRLPGSNQYVTASVFYTDEMMASRNTFDSMVVGIIVSPTRHDNALLAENSAQSQVRYTSANDKIQVKTRIRVDDRLLVAGLECQSNREVELPEPHIPPVGDEPLAFLEKLTVDHLRPIEIECKSVGSLPFETVAVTYEDKEKFKREYRQIREDLDQQRDGVVPAQVLSCTFAYQGVVFDRWARR
jgi:hypothetical protein